MFSDLAWRPTTPCRPGEISPLRTKFFDDLQRNAQRRPSLFGSGLPGREG
jgi:hypothetical protein